ncbi:unnamed protein product, partial [Iphiclides podalirius]
MRYGFSIELHPALKRPYLFISRYSRHIGAAGAGILEDTKRNKETSKTAPMTGGPFIIARSYDGARETSTQQVPTNPEQRGDTGQVESFVQWPVDALHQNRRGDGGGGEAREGLWGVNGAYGAACNSPPALHSLHRRSTQSSKPPNTFRRLLKMNIALDLESYMFDY